jgi:hypothetical protein
MLKMKLGGGPKADLPPLPVRILSGANYDPKNRALKIAGADLNILVTALFAELQYQFGPEATKPPSPFTVAETTVSAPGVPDIKLLNALKVGWVKAAGSAPQLSFEPLPGPGLQPPGPPAAPPAPLMPVPPVVQLPMPAIAAPLAPP